MEGEVKRLEERGVWLPLEIKTERGIVRTSGLLNSGYRVEEPHIALPVLLCRKLSIEPIRFEPDAPDLWITDKVVDVRIVVGDRNSGWVKTRVHAFMYKPYILISTSLASRLGVGVYDPHEGLWFFRDEIQRIRKSARPVFYSID